MKNLNREIEFRAWDIEKKRMLQNVSSMLNNSSFILMQYIGVKDSSGKKIYEGDILEGDIPTSAVMFGEYDNHRQYADHAAGVGFYIENRDGIDKINRNMIDVYHLKVIGNIYQNPEKAETGNINDR
jgi:uncharacterized phage protein (TIGR01671 family)